MGWWVLPPATLLSSSEAALGGEFGRVWGVCCPGWHLVRCLTAFTWHRSRAFSWLCQSCSLQQVWGSVVPAPVALSEAHHPFLELTPAFRGAKKKQPVLCTSAMQNPSVRGRACPCSSRPWNRFTGSASGGLSPARPAAAPRCTRGCVSLNCPQKAAERHEDSFWS